MDIYATRDSVAAGDDIDAPHGCSFYFPDGTPVMDVIARIVAGGYLARISGGKATWSTVSGFPIAVVAQQWTEPRPVRWPEVKVSELESRNGIIYLHFNYHTQIDPEVVFEVLRNLRLRALT
jgi:hypothetical protein